MDINPKLKEMKKIIVPLFLLSLLFTQCVPSIHPYYTDKEVVEDDRILGKYFVDSDREDKYWQFSKPKGQNKSKAYMLEMVQSDGRKFQFTTQLFKLNGHYYLDFLAEPPADIDIKSNENEFPENFYSMHWWPVHTLARVKIQEDNLSINFFDLEWMEKLIKESKIRIKHEKVSNIFLLTASTANLQKFIIKYGQEKEAFPEETILKKS